ncbi:AraC family transcriptional regulator [Rhizobium sophoriradicis]|uniref:helix-turn-helix transcriptional regulator n=1 Tax=Rhizobium sophoriradicis TaxID=1535245 RepID=UPI000F766EEA|nr:AraC family transcriptional regulator [Rhizobium sophoriradicis]RSB86878.1 AraC family transcriptional regulator [Rhizobium sophoriradicis]
MRKPVNSKISLNEWAEFASLGKLELIGAFNRLTGIPPMTFHNAERLEIAKRLLVFEGMPVTEVCYEIGYESLGSFITKFTRWVGISPGAYGQAMREVGFLSIFMHAVRTRMYPRGAPTEAVDVRLMLPPRQFAHCLLVAVFRRPFPAGNPMAWRFIPPMRQRTKFDGALSGYCLAASVPRWPRLEELVCFRPALVGRETITTLDNEVKLQLNPPTIFDPPITLAVPVLFSRQSDLVEG